MPSPGYRVSGKEVELRDSGSRYHQLCGCCNLQLIQSHVAPSHGPPASVLSPLSLWLQSLSCYLSHVAKRSTPKLRGPLYSPSEPCGPFPHLLQNHMDLYLSTCFRASWFSHLLQSRVVYSFLQSRMVSSLHLLWSRVVYSFLPQNLVVLLFYFRTTWTFIYLLASEPHGSTLSFRAAWSPLPSSTLLPRVTSPFTLEPRGLLLLYGCRA